MFRVIAPALQSIDQRPQQALDILTVAWRLPLLPEDSLPVGPACGPGIFIPLGLLPASTFRG